MSVTITPALWSVLVLVVGALVVLTLTSRLTNDAVSLTTIGAMGLGAAAVPAFYGDELTVVAVVGVLAAAAIAMLLLPGVELSELSQGPEIAALLLLGSAGAIVLATANDLLSIALGLETLSLASAVLIALGRGGRPLEAAFKYFVLSAISFAFLVYGLGLIFLATGSFALPAFTSV